MKKKAPLSDYARYSAIGLQMGGIIVLTTMLGRYLDSFGWTGFPLFTVAGVLIGVFGAMYYIIKKL